MNKSCITAAVVLIAGSASAQDYGRVLSSVAVMQQVAVPRQVCTSDQVWVQPQNSGAGAALGAIAGGALGSASGNGAGRAAATVIGAIGGAVLGNRIEGEPEARAQTVQRCSTQNFFENRAVAYNVVYEFAGKQYSVQLPNDPGPSILLQVAPAGGVAQSAAPAYPVTQPQTVYVQPAQVIVNEPYPVYYPRPYYDRPYYAPLAIGVGIGYWAGGGGYYGHRRWR